MSCEHVLISYWDDGKRLHLCPVVIVAPSSKTYETVLWCSYSAQLDPRR